MEAGDLPATRHEQIWAGRGTDHVCAVCRETIPPSVNEYEVLFPGAGTALTVLHFHLACLGAWLDECRDRQQRDPGG
jgi:hypothetical protein